MARNNKLIKPVFSDILTGDVKLYDEFLSIDNEIGIDENFTLKEHKTRYLEIIYKITDDLEELSLVEEMILQLRCKEMVQTETKLVLVMHDSTKKKPSNNYIYARTVFYRSNTDVRDIRVFVTGTHESELDSYYNDPEFMKTCRDKLISAIDTEISYTRLKLENIKEKKTFIEKI